MTPIVLTSTVGPDGTLTLVLPAEVAGREVRVTVAVMPPKMTQVEWEAWVSSMAGTWKGDFERMPQGECEQREPMS